MKQAFYSVKYERKEKKLCQSRPVARFFFPGVRFNELADQ